jgi:predicted transcriptional regulator of viral defense system
MSRFTDLIKDRIPNDYFKDAELMRLMPGSPDSRFGLVKRAIASGDIIRIRRGLYVLGERHRRSGLDLFELAPAVYGPSYISLESALSYHGWIPEGVQTTTSISPRRSKEFRTPLGVFSYSRYPDFNYIGVERIQAGRALFLMAGPTKALVDLAYVRKREWADMDALSADWRIDRDDLEKIDRETLLRLKARSAGRRIRRFIEGLLGHMNG